MENEYSLIGALKVLERDKKAVFYVKDDGRPDSGKQLKWTCGKGVVIENDSIFNNFMFFSTVWIRVDEEQRAITEKKLRELEAQQEELEAKIHELREEL